MASPQRRSADNKSATWVPNKRLAKEKRGRNQESEAPDLFQSPKRQSGYRAVAQDRASPGSSMPILIGAVIIAAAILLSTLITAVGTRFVGMETPTEETVWLIDRLTGNVYKCQASERGKASCEPDIATGSIGERGKR
jgi:hypothetical protein